MKTLVVTNKEFNFPKIPEEIKAIQKAGGLLEYTRFKLKNKNK